jgi:hypothetical protein
LPTDKQFSGCHRTIHCYQKKRQCLQIAERNSRKPTTNSNQNWEGNKDFNFKVSKIYLLYLSSYIIDNTDNITWKTGRTEHIIIKEDYNRYFSSICNVSGTVLCILCILTYLLTTINLGKSTVSITNFQSKKINSYE